MPKLFEIYIVFKHLCQCYVESLHSFKIAIYLLCNGSPALICLLPTLYVLTSLTQRRFHHFQTTGNSGTLNDCSAAFSVSAALPKLLHLTWYSFRPSMDLTAKTFDTL